MSSTTIDEQMLDNDDPRLRAAWHPVARSQDVGPAGLEVRLNNTEYALTREGTRVREGHGSENTPFDPVTITTGHENAYGVDERYGLVWIAQQEPKAPLPRVPEWFDPAYHSDVLVESTHVSAGVLTDNFLDVTHFSYLHRQSFGRSRPVTDDGYSIQADGEHVVLRHDTVLQESRRNSDGGLGERRIATYSYWPPYLTHLQMYFPLDGSEAAATLVCQPESATSTRAYVLVAIPRIDPDLAAQVAFSRRVLQEDLLLVERMADPRLCLDVRAELHTRADRASIEMRRLLRAHLTQAMPAGVPA